MLEPFADENDEHDDSVRFLIEQGDMGFRPRGDFPFVYGKSVEAQIWGATVGRTEKEHLRSLRYELERRYPHIYPWKILARRKHGSKSLKPDETARNLTKEQFYNLYNAISFANSVGAVLNVHVIVSWRLLGFDDQSEAAKVLQYRFIKPMKEWYYSKSTEGSPLAWIYSNECSSTIGFHTHILTNIPYELRPEFREWVRRRLAKISRTGSVPQGAHRIVAPPSDPIKRQWIYFQYLCKGLDPTAVAQEACEDLEEGATAEDVPLMLSDFVSFEYESPGQITCKIRAAVSQNIGATERSKHCFTSLLDQGFFDIRHLYSAKEYEEWERQRAIQKLNI